MPGHAAPHRPISFVCVRFCDEFEHNIQKSDCVHDPFNQFIIVDNTQNLFFETLGQAINSGITQAIHDLIVVVHEDVLLLPGWQPALENSLDELEKHDPDWGLVGAVGWTETKQSRGHWSDPHNFHNTFTDQNFSEVEHLDEQILIFRKSIGLKFDGNLPSIHNIGKDLAWQLAKDGRKTYAVNAPTIHKFADSAGTPIACANQSPKIKGRRQLTYLADKSCSDDYLADKWCSRPPRPQWSSGALSQAQQNILNAPIILLGRGGGGTRLVSLMAQDCGLFVGNKVNQSGDCLDLVHQIYRSVLQKFDGPDRQHRMRSVPELLMAARDMLIKSDWAATWGFKLPESTLILPELRTAFPNAKYVHFTRDPVTTILRRPHMTARTDNHIGRIALAQAYDHFGIDRKTILSDNDVDRMAITTMHQLALIQNHQAQIDPANWLELRFEAAIEDPPKELEKLSRFIGLPVATRRFEKAIDKPRSMIPSDFDTPEIRTMLQKTLKRLQAR